MGTYNDIEVMEIKCKCGDILTIHGDWYECENIEECGKQIFGFDRLDEYINNMEFLYCDRCMSERIQIHEKGRWDCVDCDDEGDVRQLIEHNNPKAVKCNLCKKRFKCTYQICDITNLGCKEYENEYHKKTDIEDL